ncbi:hypothetical protein ACH5RR_018985 [Cinchona calisaya]|uniref:Transmembrane protein n=1 Tax=Cinchona calisaya TaxID=153742 RepID=A0ABD2ZT76_9GENT
MKSILGLNFTSLTQSATITKPSFTDGRFRPSSHSTTILPFNFPHFYHHFPLKSKTPLQFLNHRNKSSFSDDNNNNSNNNGEDGDRDPLRKDENKEKEIRENGRENGNGNERPRFNLKWVDLLLDPDPENVVAVGLTGVLAWASVQVLWQLFVISIAILLAALKYSFVAALLIFILITLL